MSSPSSKSKSKQSSSSSHAHPPLLSAPPKPPGASGTTGASLSLPLLEGLCRRPATARGIVQKALTKWQAAQKIAHWVATKYWQQQKKKKKKKQPSSALVLLPSSIPYRQCLPPQQHWLWDAMRSASRSERHVAAQLLLQGGCPCGSCRTTTAASSSSSAQEEHDQWQLQHVLVALWNAHVLPSPAASTAISSYSVAVATLPSSNIPVEWMALLKHVVLGKMVTEERILAFCVGGIPWMTQSIWQLVTALSATDRNSHAAGTQMQALLGLVELLYSLLLVVFVEQPEPAATAAVTATDTPGSPAATTPSSSRRRGRATANPVTATSPPETKTSESSETSAASITKRLASRRRILKRLFWKSMTETTDATKTATAPVAKQHHTHPHHQLPTQNPLSPLACLTGAFHVWKTNTDWPFPGPTADACLTMLRQLVDPNATAKAVSLAGIAAPASGTTVSPPGSGVKRPGEAPNSTSSRQKRRKRTRSSSSATSASQQQQQQQQQQQASGGFSFRSSAAASNAQPAVGERRRTSGDNAERAIPRLLSSVLGDGSNTNNNQHAGGDEDEDEELDDVFMEIADEDDDDDEIDSDGDGVEVIMEHHDVGNEEAAVAPEDDEEIDSEDENDEEEEAQEEHAVEETGEHNDEDDEEDDEHDDDDDDDLDDDDDELDHDEHDEIVARLEEGFLSLNDAAGPMDLDLDDLVGGEGAGAAGLMMAARGRARDAAGGAPGADTGGTSGASKSTLSASELTERKRLHLQACMQVLAVQHPPLLSVMASSNGLRSVASSRAASPVPPFRAGLMSPGGSPPSPGQIAGASKCFSLAAENSLMESVMSIVRPPKKPVNTKMIMRRAPTQEEFFRGSLSRNPISLSMLKPTGAGNGGASGDGYEPTVRDLRQHIADDLQMSDSAEMLELIVANKIIGIDLKLRVVHQVLWKNHLMEHSHSAGAASSSGSTLASLLAGSGGAAPSFFSTGSGLSMMFSSGVGGMNVGVGGGRVPGGVLSRGGAGSAITEDTPLAALPPLVVTYRLAGVDGEATEDTVNALVDPEAPSDAMSPKEVERLMEREYGITRIVTEGRGVFVVMRSIEHYIQDVLRRIRRDDISTLMEYPHGKSAIGKNISRNKFKSQPPYHGLTLLQCCAKLPSNREKLLQARAPTILLRLLLDVLNALQDPQTKLETVDHVESGDSVGNKTAAVLQELIEALASDISSTAAPSVREDPSAMDDSKTDDTLSTTDSVAAAAEGQAHDELTFVLSSLETISLSPPLRNIIAKLLPFLTYGQEDLSRELALNFARNIDINALVDDDNPDDNVDMADSELANAIEQTRFEKENENAPGTPTRGETPKSSVLMDAFVQASISLPPNEVCNSLRSELINCGFIHRLASFILKGIPSSPPPWATALLPPDDTTKTSPTKKRLALINGWRIFFQRQGLLTSLKMLIGLCKHHPRTQVYISQIGEDTDKFAAPDGKVSFLQACHWLESTSDSTTNRVYVRGVGLLAETLMDEVMDENEFVGKRVNALRRATRNRKKEIAEARRSKTLSKMSSFGAQLRQPSANEATRSPAGSSGVRASAASLLAPVLGFFGSGAASANDASDAAGPSSASSRTSPRNSSRSRQKATAEGINKAKPAATKMPAWMLEMENLEDEEGLVCSVCQEGKSFQPSELLGLYAYVKKVSIPPEQCGSRDNIDGTTLLRTLPSTLPKSLAGSHAAEQWYPAGKAAGEDLRDGRGSAYSLSSSISNRRNSYYTTTVSAGNAIHFSCHAKAREADRTHPKAPKSEWEGAILRNSRVSCNLILPLVREISEVPLVAVDSALTEYQTAVNNLTGSAPKSMLWTVLHDVRFLLLRMCHSESLNSDCGGGSQSSNAQLLIHQLLMADMFEKDAQVDSPETSQHVQSLSAGFLAASSIVHAKDYKKSTSSVVVRGIADSAPMAALTCILIRNSRDDFGTPVGESAELTPHPKRRWILGKEHFLRGLVICAGRRHALGIETSGCTSGRGGSSGGGRPRSGSTSFPDWEIVDGAESGSASATAASSATARTSSSGGGRKKKRSKADINDFGRSLRPMITLFGILDQLSEDFVVSGMKDADIEQAASRIVSLLEQCRKAKDIRELLAICKASTILDDDEILADFQRGLVSA